MPPSPARAQAKPSAGANASARSATATPAAERDKPAASAAAERDKPPAAEPAAAAPAAAERDQPERRAARKPAKPKAPPSLTITVTYAEGEWMVGATQGSRAVAKPYVIRASDALKMVALLDVPGVHEAVEHIVASARSEAEREAERLRAELAEVEARLAELRDAS